MAATAAAALARPRIATAALVLIAAVALLRYEIAPVPTWFYVFAWYPTLVILDQVVAVLGGGSLLARPRDLLAMLWWSAVIWFVFEAINLRLQDWYYVFLPAARLERWIGITVSLATVVPAVLLPEQVLDRLGVWHELRAQPVPLRPKQVRVAFWLGWAILALVLALPRYVYPLTWGAGWLIAEPLLYQQQPDRSLFRDIARGSWGRIARLMAAGLFAGILWESFNALARGRWIYTVPFLERAKIFEMPPVGFLGFPFFALEVWSLYHLVAARSTRRAVLASLAVVGLALVGIDRWTVSSTAPELRDLPGVTNAVLGRLEAAGWDDVFRVARSPAAELAYRANLTPADARAAHEAARLVILRGIGTAHAAALIGGGIGTVEELAAADPEVVWRIARGPTRPTKAEVRVWVRGAQREAGAAPRGAGPGPGR
jgi:predicted flap endonuclease-1-like 5' DNA nuclease